MARESELCTNIRVCVFGARLVEISGLVRIRQQLLRSLVAQLRKKRALHQAVAFTSKEQVGSYLGDGVGVVHVLSIATLSTLIWRGFPAYTTVRFGPSCKFAQPFLSLGVSSRLTSTRYGKTFADGTQASTMGP